MAPRDAGAEGTDGAGGVGSAPGVSAAGDADGGGTGGMTSSDPLIPALTATCPDFANGTITFMGLGGIEIVAGTAPAGPTAPMVFYWHGTGSTSGEYALLAAAVQQGVVSEGGVLVSFQDSTGGDALSGTAIFGAGDVVLTDQLVACAVKNHNVSPRRIYTLGCGAGGLFAAAMAAMRSSYIAAASTSSGGWTAMVPFESAHTPALMTAHARPGLDVPAVDFSQASGIADRAFKAAGGFVVDCDTGSARCVDALAPEFWKFFEAHPFGFTPEPYAAGLPSSFPTSCTIVP